MSIKLSIKRFFMRREARKLIAYAIDLEHMARILRAQNIECESKALSARIKSCSLMRELSKRYYPPETKGKK